MGAGFQGEVTRTHPASIFPRMNDASSPVAQVGLACMFNGSANDVRAMASGDNGSTAIEIAGVVVRPFPFQAQTGGNFGSAGYGSAGTPAQVVDVLQSGSILMPTVGTPNLGGTVYIWCASSSGSHVQGGAEASATGGSTVPLASAYFNGPPDANGLCEVVINAP